MIKVGVLGAKGRMGAEVVRAVREADGLALPKRQVSHTSHQG